MATKLAEREGDERRMLEARLKSLYEELEKIAGKSKEVEGEVNRLIEQLKGVLKEYGFDDVKVRVIAPYWEELLDDDYSDDLGTESPDVVSVEFEFENGRLLVYRSFEKFRWQTYCDHEKSPHKGYCRGFEKALENMGKYIAKIFEKTEIGKLMVEIDKKLFELKELNEEYDELKGTIDGIKEFLYEEYD